MNKKQLNQLAKDIVYLFPTTIYIVNKLKEKGLFEYKNKLLDKKVPFIINSIIPKKK